MKKWLSYGFSLLMLTAAGALVVNAPDWLAILIVSIMTVILFMGFLFGLRPIIQFSNGFDHAMANIQKVQRNNPSSPWVSICKLDSFFGLRTLDRYFDEYRQKAEVERKSGMVVSDIDGIINEEELALRCWHGVMLQVPGTLTGLGILGTFLGLVVGISGIQISSIDATITSIQQLLSGIQVAFYTSISGVILSIFFNIFYKLEWNVMLRNMGMFISVFQRNVIPTVDEQLRYAQKQDMNKILQHLNDLPKLDAYPAALGGSPSLSGSSENVLMPQILAGIQNQEFTFQLQPRYDLNSQKVIGAEALMRWNHPKMGVVSPALFMPVLEQNGYIAKLDQYLWDKVCSQMRSWIDAGIHPIPISVNLSKTDIMALDITSVFTGLVQKYRLPPRYIELDIAQGAYMEVKDIVLDFEKKAQQMGFRVVVDGFQGDFFALRSDDTLPSADAYKLDVRSMKDDNDIISVANQAHNLHVSLLAEGIESTKQLKALRKNGIVEGQGFCLSKAIPVSEFEKLMGWSK